MYTTTNAPPPRPELYWCATPAANAVAIAASTAFPPRPRISRPASAAGPTEVTTMPRSPHAGPGPRDPRARRGRGGGGGRGGAWGERGVGEDRERTRLNISDC